MKSSNGFIYPKSRVLKASELPRVYRTLRAKFGSQDWWPGDTPFEVMVGAILTQNAAWINVEKAIRNLKTERALTPRVMQKLPLKKLARLIRPAGYFNVKAGRLKHFLSFFFEEYGGSIKRMAREDDAMLREKLLGVKGVGPETADSILLYALNKPFFVIDTYTKRIFSRHRLHPWKKQYGDWQGVFTRALPIKTSLYNDYHAQIVALGKHFCKTRPQCEDCPLRQYL